MDLVETILLGLLVFFLLAGLLSLALGWAKDLKLHFESSTFDGERVDSSPFDEDGNVELAQAESAAIEREEEFPMFGRQWLADNADRLDADVPQMRTWGCYHKDGRLLCTVDATKLADAKPLAIAKARDIAPSLAWVDMRVRLYRPTISQVLDDARSEREVRA